MLYINNCKWKATLQIPFFSPSFYRSLALLPCSPLTHYAIPSLSPPSLPHHPPLLVSGWGRWAITQPRLSPPWFGGSKGPSGAQVPFSVVFFFLFFFSLSLPSLEKKKKKKEKLICEGPQDGRLNDGHRSFSNKFHGAWSKDNSFSAPMTIQLPCQSKPTACCLIMIKSGCQLKY